MTQEQMVLRRIDWQGTFAFTRLFSGFRSALHSTRIVLALAGLFLTFLLGGVLDSLWVKAGQGVWPGEVAAFADAGGRPGYAGVLAEQKYEALADSLLRLGIAGGQAEALQQARSNPAPSVVMAEEKVINAYREGRKTASTPEAQAALLSRMQTQLRQLNDVRPVGPFREFMTYQMATFRGALLAAAQLRFTDGLDAVVHGLPPTAAQLQAMGEPLSAPGALASIVMVWYGLMWLLKAHWVYSLLFVPGALAIWALAGGGISRAAVVQFARDERIGVREAVRFATTKFWGFFFAPVVSLLFIVAFGVLLMAGGLVGSIPFVGDILVGVLWFLALLAGLAIAFITIGLLAGGHLFAPVIAAEGSDAFDAISRGFVYVYSRPWKSVLYGLTLAVYGSLCYLFLRLFVWLMLAATHGFVGAGMLASRPQAGQGMHKLDVVWQAPTFLNLRPQVLDWQLLGAGEVLLFGLIAIWTYIVWGLLQSWLVSFYFTGSSMAYLLLRQDVDAIDTAEIYAEEAPEADGLTEPATAPAPVPAASAAPAPVAATISQTATTPPPSETGPVTS